MDMGSVLESELGQKGDMVRERHVYGKSGLK